MNELSEVVLLGTVFIVGLISSGVYYFARFFMFKGMDDAKSLEQAKEAPKKLISLSEALSKSRKGLWSSGENLPVASIEELEESLYMADLGPQTVAYLTEKTQEQIKGEAFSLDKVKAVFKAEMVNIFEGDDPEARMQFLIDEKQDSPHVIAIVGVNGAGKTTSIGKLANKFSKAGKKVMVAAGDTFRAAAESQLDVWAQRSDAVFFKASAQTKDPGAVAFQAYEKAVKEGIDILLIDTAGRLHTQDNLMMELEKVKRVLAKQNPKAPQDIWMILDANTGMNALHQAKAFNEVLGLTGVIMTKVDGSAKAGMALGVRQTLGVPILMLGVGEGMEDLRMFRPSEFVESLVSS